MSGHGRAMTTDPGRRWRDPTMRRRCGRALAECVTAWDAPAAGDGLAEWVDHPAGRDRIVVGARHHGIVPAVHLCLQAIGRAELLRGDHDRALARHLRARADLLRVAFELDDAGLPWLTFKGPLLAEHVYPRPDLRSYRDLDLLVPAQSMPAAVRVLRRSGFEVADRNWELFRREVRGEVHLLGGHGTPVDLHWHPINWQGARHGLTIDTSEWLRRSRRVGVAGRAIPTLDVADGLVHLALHAALSGADRLRWLQDLHHVISSEPPDWDEVVHRARRSGVDTAVWIALRRLVVALGTPVPVTHLSRLQPGCVTTAVSNGLTWTWSRRGMAQTPIAGAWAKTARRSGTATIASMSRRAWRRRRYVTAQAGVGATPLQSRDIGGREGREAFLELVAAGGTDG